MDPLALSMIVSGYLLGSIPSACIASYLKGVNIMEVGDGRIGAANAYRKMGALTGISVGIADVGKGAAAVLIAQWLALPMSVVLLTGLAAVVGHDWSLFLRFKGGKGAATTYGVLLTLMFWELLIVCLIASIPYLITRRSTLTTGIMFVLLSVIAWQFGWSRLLIAYPITLSLPMWLKHYQTTRRAVTGAEQRNRLPQG